MATGSVKDAYILSLEQHCTVSDALRVAETVSHALEKDVQALQNEVETLKSLVGDSYPRKRGAPASIQPSDHAPKKQATLAPPSTSTNPYPSSSTTTNPSPFPHLTESTPVSNAASSTITPSGSPPLYPQSYPASSNASVPKFMSPYVPSEIALSLDFTLAPPPNVFPSGSPNTRNLRAWTDILRAKYPTFKRTSPSMSKSAKEFMSKKNGGAKLYVASLTGDRVSRPTHAVGEEHIAEFVAFMEGLYLRNGMFGEASCHDL
ncbi:UNVERIFIED_CONTAM: hypothetical protein HDU68_000325 [Siphonaria sp. JEL0065]|nr:hypothetical protein HDU68_000325 [Siphonaria sp. JEL0065]